MSTDQFNIAYAKWLSARAAMAANNANDSGGDKKTSAVLDAADAAEWELLKTPAANLNDIRIRASVVLEMFAYADVAGPPTDNRHRLMLAALVAEISSPLAQQES